MLEQIHHEQDAKVLLNTLLGVLHDVGILTWDAQGRITSLSEGCRKLMQLPDSATVGGSIGVLSQTPCKAFLQTYEEFAKASDKSLVEEVFKLARDGESYWLRLSLRRYPKRSTDDAVFFLVVRDVTAQHRSTEQTQQESLEKFRAIFDKAPVGVVVLAVEDGAILDANPASLQMYGYERDEYLQLKLWETVVGITPQNYADKWRRLIERRRSRFESEHRRKDGSSLHVLVDANRMQLKGREVIIGTLVDISRQKQLESRLWEQQHHYRTLVESSNAILFTADPTNFRFRFVSPEAEKLLGYPVSAWSKEANFWLDHLHPDDRQWVPIHSHSMIKVHKDYEFECRMIAADGRVVWLHNSTRVITKGGTVVSLVGVMVDISESKQAEAERRLLSEMVEQSADAILLTDRDFCITYINESFTRLYGYSLEELRGKRPEILNAQSLDKTIYPEIYHELRSGHRVYRQLLNQRKDGRLFHCQHSITPLWNDQGGVIAYMSSQRDVSVQVEAEQALRASEEKYRQIVETAYEGIWVLDVAARTTFVNPRMAEMLGYVQEEMPGCSMYAFMDEANQEQARGSWERLMSEGEAIFDLCLRRKDGADLWCHVSSSLLRDDRGEIRAAMALLTDISEQRQLTEALIRVQKMEAVGQLTGGIAHDFNNILGSILGFAELSQMRFGRVDHKLHEYLEQIETAGGRARDLIRQLLIFSRGENIRSAVPIPLAPLVKEIVKMLMPMLPAAIEIRSELPQESPCVKVDPLHVQQILMNLCINARDAIEEHGLITIQVKRRRCSDEHCAICSKPVSGDWVSIRVADTGEGIDESLRDDIFQPFVTSKEVGQGSGMGLPVVRGIVKSYDGHLLVESTPGRGASFEILLPEAQQDSQVDEQAQASTGDDIRLEGVRILAVDDEPQFRAFFEELFGGAGAEVVCCHSGVQALGKYQRDGLSFDLIITDQSMPGMSGTEMVRHLRDLGCRTPVILCSGYVHEMDNELIEGLQIDELLDKPASAGELLVTIRRILG
jgi:PAS domain S-box-containing protein